MRVSGNKRNRARIVMFHLNVTTSKVRRFCSSPLGARHLTGPGKLAGFGVPFLLLRRLMGDLPTEVRAAYLAVIGRLRSAIIHRLFCSFQLLSFRY